jgi:hypothetical protein
MKKFQEAIDKKVAAHDYEDAWIASEEVFPFEILKGKTLKAIIVTDNCVEFQTIDGEGYELSHSQDCCESVYIESVVGDIEDLVGNPILLAEAVS